MQVVVVRASFVQPVDVSFHLLPVVNEHTWYSFIIAKDLSNDSSQSPVALTTYVSWILAILSFVLPIAVTRQPTVHPFRIQLYAHIKQFPNSESGSKSSP